MLQELTTTNWVGDLSLYSLILNLIICLVISFILGWHFRKFGSTLSNRDELSAVLPFIAMTTVLIISVVKSSLALSLGLVGALSIVRFRTPIKEPEELAYLFLAIGIGLGLGASQTAATILASATILVAMAILGKRRFARESKNLFLAIDMDMPDGEDSREYLQKLNKMITSHAVSTDLRRFDVRGKNIEATYLIDVESPAYLSALVDELRAHFPSIGITFLDQKNMRNV